MDFVFVQWVVDYYDLGQVFMYGMLFVIFILNVDVMVDSGFEENVEVNYVCSFLRFLINQLNFE